MDYDNTALFPIAMMYSDFTYRPPPPSYQASMQEYRLRLLLLDRGHPNSVLQETQRNERSQQQQQQQHQQQLEPVSGAISTTAIIPHQSSGQTTAIGNLSPPPAYRAHLRYTICLIVTSKVYMYKGKHLT